MDIERLKQAKKEKKITYEQLSKLSGVPLSTIYDLFRGITVAPRVDTLVAIEKVLGLNQAPLEWTEEDKAAGIGKHTVILSNEEWEWLELRSDIINAKGEEYYKTFVTLIRGLLK